MLLSLFMQPVNRIVKISNGSKLLVDELTTTQEEVDTRLFLHAAHASRLGHEKFTIHSPDTRICHELILLTPIRWFILL